MTIGFALLKVSVSTQSLKDTFDVSQRCSRFQYLVIAGRKALPHLSQRSPVQVGTAHVEVSRVHHEHFSVEDPVASQSRDTEVPHLRSSHHGQ